MQLLSTRSLLAFGSVLSLASATINLTFPFSSVTTDETYELGWTQDTNYNLELLLVRQTDSGWDAIDKLWENRVFGPHGGGYNWTVRKGYESGSGYGLWLYGQSIPYDGTGYANLTDWFEIRSVTSYEGDEELR